MANLNDEKIILLKKQINEKKEKLGKIKRFTPITNCSIELDGTRHNINVLQKEQLIHILVKLNSYKHSAKDLGLSDEYAISGYKIEEWMEDIKARLDKISVQQEEIKLHVMENKLTELLSNEKKVELELLDIENSLK